MSLELTNRDPTHRITLNIQIWLSRVLSGVRDVHVMLDIVHADQNNVMVWTWTTRSIYLKALCLSVLSITDHYGQVRRDSITNISPSQSEAPIVTQLTNQKPSIVPGVRPNTLPDCWISGCPRIINFTLRCFCSCGWHLDPALGPPPHITSPDTIFIFIAPLSWDKTQTWSWLYHSARVPPEQFDRTC